MASSAQRQRVHQIIGNRRAEHLDRIRGYIAQPSIAKENLGIRDCAQMTLGYFQELGCQTAEIVETPGLPAVWAHYDAGAEKTLAVYGYYDTNVLGSGWTYEPFGAVVAERAPYKSVLYGRGANNKAGLLAFLNALGVMREVDGNLPVNLMFVVEGEEFLGSEHVPWLIDRFRSQLCSTDALFSPKPCQSASGDVQLFLGNKGCLHMELACTGEQWGHGPVGGTIHSSAQGVVDSPVWRLVAALNTLYDPAANRILIDGFYDRLLEPTAEELALIDRLAAGFAGREASALPGISAPERIKAFVDDATGKDVFTRYCFQPTMNINGLRAGYTGPGTLLWTLPTAAYTTIDIRLPAYLDPHECVDMIRRHLDRHGYTDISIAVLEAAMGDHPLRLEDAEFQAAQRVFQAWHVEPVIWPRRGAGGPTGFFSQMLDIKMLNSTGMTYASGHSDANEFFVVEGNDRVGGLVQMEQSLADLMYSYALYPQPMI